MNLTELIKKSLVAACALSAAFAITANANLVENGDFEEVDDRVGMHGRQLDELADTNNWDVYASLPGWNLIGLAGIEVQANTIVDAQSGNHYVELDTHGANSNAHIWTSFDVVDAGFYDLSFWYQPRTNSADDNGFWFNWGHEDAETLTFNFTSSEVTDWTEVVYELDYLTVGSYSFGFEAFGIENTLGVFIDNVSVTAVPEPGSLALMGLGLIGLGYSRRKTR